MIVIDEYHFSLYTTYGAFLVYQFPLLLAICAALTLYGLQLVLLMWHKRLAGSIIFKWHTPKRLLFWLTSTTQSDDPYFTLDRSSYSLINVKIAELNHFWDKWLRVICLSHVFLLSLVAETCGIRLFFRTPSMTICLVVIVTRLKQWRFRGGKWHIGSRASDINLNFIINFRLGPWKLSENLKLLLEGAEPTISWLLLFLSALAWWWLLLYLWLLSKSMCL